MKKLSLIVAMAVILTVGGVFATWTYPADTSVAGGAPGVAISITNTTDGEADALTISGAISVSADQKDVGDYHTEWTQTGTLTIAFTAKNGSVYQADPDKELAVTWKVEVVNAGEYEGTPIVKAGDGTTDTTNIKTGGSFNVTYSQLGLEFNEFELKTKSEHTAFDTALDSVQIKVTISATAA